MKKHAPKYLKAARHPWRSSKKDLLGKIALQIFFMVIPFNSHAQATGSNVDLNVNLFKLITFAKIPPTTYQNDGPVLRMRVDKSSAFLLQPFLKKQQITSVTFEWKSDGLPNTQNPKHEQTREGDDAPLRIGLLVNGPEPIIPFFASAWIKAVRDHMRLPSDEMIYVAVGTKNPPGSRWDSPYSSSIHISVADDNPLGDGWRRASFNPPKPLEVVGLWIMADGDNTQASFTSYLRQLTLNGEK